MKFSIGDLLIFNRTMLVGSTPRTGTITSIDRERIGVRWICYNGTSFNSNYIWHRLEEMIDRKNVDWYPA